MSTRTETVENLYRAFAVLDAPAMASAYAPEARFADGVFNLNGRDEIAAMWEMLCHSIRSTDPEAWTLAWSNVVADGDTVRAHWEPVYRFSATKRLVHNVLDARFEFNAKGLITLHQDQFNFWRWSRQALGPVGLVLGWTTLLQRKVQQQAAANLAAFRARQP